MQTVNVSKRQAVGKGEVGDSKNEETEGRLEGCSKERTCLGDGEYWVGSTGVAGVKRAKVGESQTSRGRDDKVQKEQRSR